MDETKPWETDPGVKATKRMKDKDKKCSRYTVGLEGLSNDVRKVRNIICTMGNGKGEERLRDDNSSLLETIQKKVLSIMRLVTLYLVEG